LVHQNAFVIGFITTLLLIAPAGAAFAEPSDGPTPTLPSGTPATSAATPRPPSKPAAQGIAVLAAGQSHDEAFTLARAVYKSRLRPTSVDEAHARILAGEAVPNDAPTDLRDLAALRAAITGDDAPSRRLLASLAKELGVSAMLVVMADQNRPVARLFLTDVGEFDAARYVPSDAAADPSRWGSAVSSLERRFATTPAAASSTTAAPAAALHAIPPLPPKPHEDESKPFYLSPWFWGAVGAAAVVGGGIYLMSRDTGTDQIHLKMQLPH